MEKPPFKTTGIYFSQESKHDYNSSKLGRIWNVMTNQDKLNNNIYDIIRFGEIRQGKNNISKLDSNTETLISKYFIYFATNFVTEDFNEYAKKFSYSINTQNDIWLTENELHFYDVNIKENKVEFENKRWKCVANMGKSTLELEAINKENEQRLIKKFNYFLG